MFRKITPEDFLPERPRPPPPEPPPAVPVLKQDNLFHPYTKSPIPRIRRRAAFIKTNAYCPHPDHHMIRLPAYRNAEQRLPRPGNPTLPPALVDFECPYCGIPVYCSDSHWADHYEEHLELCDILRQINQDDHDLHSGRDFPEFMLAGPRVVEEALINFTNWDTFNYTRDFDAINEMRPMRQATRILTYPATIASIVSELSPYNLRKGGRLTPDGSRSFNALRYSLHPPKDGAGTDMKSLKPRAPAVRIFVLGARAESSLPRHAWLQLSCIFPRVAFHLIFIGPESMMGREKELPLPERTPANPFGAVVEDRLGGSTKISTFVEYYQTLHESGLFHPFDPYLDCFVLYHPGLGHPATAHEWEPAIPQLLSTKVPIIVTGYTEYDMYRDRYWVDEVAKGEYDVLLEPGENRFRSLRWDLSDVDPQDVSAGNWGVWAFRGKRYEAVVKD